ncbi:unnamed protein product [Rotaria magnacalcarata]|uniref:HAT C-terminal dimerisation domain-containing protein n=1 Tax=Rotaria magnacalcarata TaxID=392030 RepID=A0A816Y0D0_9BILA|nr:unnamed protein product [Rotaria magnacalcarata]CAF3859813.1 unnamed protein product [Rotaria magnacalcarata]
MVHPLTPSYSEMSSNEVISGYSSISFASPKHDGRQRDPIWLHFNDMGLAKKSAKLKEEAQRMKLKTETLHTIVTTRWSSVAECLDSFIVLRAPLEALVATDKSIAHVKIINIINNRSFFHDIENLYKVMKPLAYAMSIIQSASITLADCYVILQYLRLTIDEYANNAETRTFGRFISKVVEIRLKMFHNDLYLSAYYLHPKYRGSGMLTDGRALQRFEIKSGPYALHFTQGKYYHVLFATTSVLLIDDTPTSSWCSMINDNTHKNSLSDIALRLFSVTPHSVMPERLFSILDWHHTNRRKRLNQFMLKTIAKIHTFYTNRLNNTDEIMDSGYLEEMLDLTDD